MKSILLPIVTAIILLSCPIFTFGQAPDLGSAANFALFTSVGAVTNSGISYNTKITGNVGTNSAPTITGFGNVDGQMHYVSDPASAQCAVDLLLAYNTLGAAVPDSTIGVVIGNGDTLPAGIYLMPGAASLNLNLFLDAKGDPNAVFIFKTTLAFSTSANAKVNLINGALACNVFWKLDGAVTMGSGTTFRGTIISGGAISLGTNDTLEGRALTINGAILTDQVLIYTPIGCGSPILSGPVPPALASTACYALFSSIGPVTDNGSATFVNGGGDVGNNGGGLTTGFDPLKLTGDIHSIDPSTALCASDLLNVYNYLVGLAPGDIELLYPAQFGHNLVLTPHTYIMLGAVTLTDTVFLNAGGNSDAVFIILVNGAFSTSTYSKITLTNGAKAENVYWKIDGVVNINEYSIFNGTIISQGAINLKTGVVLNGRALTGVGALATFAMTVNTPVGCGLTASPNIDSVFSNQTVCAGDSLSFIVTATGTDITYQWRKGDIDLIDGGNISGANSDTLTINPVSVSDSSSKYNVVVSGALTPNDTSMNLSLTVDSSLIINSAPINQIICGGDFISFIVNATGSNIIYKWRKGDIDLIDGGNISGANSDTLTINPTVVSDTASNYNVIIQGNCSFNDTLIVSLTITPTLTITSTTPDTICDSGTATLGATASAGTINWYADSTGGLSMGTGTSFVTLPIPVTDTFYVDATIGACTTASRSAVIALVNATPTITTTTTDSICDSGIATLAATASAGTINWYADSTGGLSMVTGTSFVTLPISVTDTFYVDATIGACTTPSRSAVVALVNTTPTIITTTTDTICDLGIATLGATASAGTINWYADSTGGLSMGTGTSFVTLPISVTDTFYVDATVGTCTTASRSAVIALVNATPTITTTTTDSICSINVATLGATASAGTINWYADSTGGLSMGTGTSFVTLPISVTDTFYVDATIAACTTPSRSAVIALVNTTPTIITTTTDTICDSGIATLGATASAGTINWYADSTGGLSMGTGTSFVTLPISVTDTFYVDATIGACTTDSRSSVIALVNTTPTIITTTTDTVCDSGIATLGATASAGTINWYADSIGGLSMGAGISFVTLPISVTDTFYVDATIGACTTPSRSAVIALVNITPTIITTTTDSICSINVATLGATASAGTINWYADSIGGLSMGIGNSFITPVISVTDTFYVDAIMGLCTTASRTAVIALVNTTPTIITTTTDSICESGIATLGATASAGTINWYADSTGGLSMGTGISFVTLPISVTDTFYVDATIGACTTPSRSAIIVLVNTTPTITTTTTDSICSIDIATLGATASAGTINWYADSIGGLSMGTGTSFVTLPISVTDTFYVDATIGACTTPSRSAVIALVNTTPTIITITTDSICDPGIATLGATASAGTINWYADSTGGLSMGAGISFVTLPISVTDTFYVDATVGVCTTASRSAVVALVNTLATTTDSICDSGTATLGATASAGIINWYANSTGGLSMGTGNSFITPVISVTDTFYVDATIGACTNASRTAVIALVNITPTITTTTTDSICSIDIATLGATASAGTINWYADSTGGLSMGTGTSFVTLPISVTDTFYVDATMGNCTTPSRTAVIALVNTTPTIITTTTDSICDSGIATLGATASAGTINWYADSTGGLSMGTGISFITPVILVTDTFYVDATMGVCTNASRSAVIALVNTTPTITTTTTDSICDLGTATLGATASAGTINWYPVSTGGLSMGTGTSFVTLSISVTDTFYVDATVGNCTTASRSAVIALVDTTPTITTTTTDSICDSGTATLGATASAGTINWYADSTGGLSIGTGISFITPVILVTDTFYVDATIGACTTTSRTAVIALVNTLTTTTDSICDSGTATLGATASAGTINWYANSTGGLSIGTGISFITPVISVTDTFYVDATIGACTNASRSAVVALVNTTPTIITTTTDSICDSGTATLGATASAGTINWYADSTGGLSMGTGTSFVTLPISVTDTFYVDATIGACTTPSRSAVIALVNTTPTIITTTTDTICDLGIATLGATASAGTINWYADSTGGLSMGTGTSFVTLPISVTDTFYVDATMGACTTASRFAVIALVNTTPTIITTTTDTICDLGIATLGATASAGIINWYADSTGGLSMGTGTSFVTLPISVTDTFYVYATIGACTTPSRSAVIALVNTTPTIITTTTDTICDSGIATLGATASAGTINWYADSTGGLSMGTGTSFVTLPISVTDTFYVDATVGTCTTVSRSAVVALVNTTPTIITTTTDTICDLGIATLGATASAGTINWYADSTGGLSMGTGTSFVTLPISVTDTFYVDATVGTCTTPSRSAVVALVNTTPTIITTPTDTICDLSIATLVATASAGTINWYADSTGGLSMGTGTSFVTLPISVTDTFYVDATVGTCTTPSRSAVVALVNTTPTITTIITDSICDSGIATLGATASAGTINWYADSTGGLSMGTGTSFVTLPISVTDTFYVDATVGTCTTPSRSAVVALVNTTPTITTIITDSICDSGIATLGATASAGTINWYADSTGGLSMGTGTFFVTLPISVTDTFYVDATVGTCTTPSRSAVVALVNTTPTIITTTTDSICDSGTATLGATASAGTINWYANSTGGLSIAMGNSFITPVISVTDTLYVDATVGACTTPSRSAVVALVSVTPIINNIANLILCNNASSSIITFSGGVAVTTYNWTNDNLLIGLGADGNGNIPSFTSINTGTEASIATIIVTPITNGCIGISDSFTINVNPTPIALANSNSSICINHPINLIAQTVVGGSYLWTNTNGYSSTSQNPIIPSASLSDAGEYSLIVSLNDCPSDVSLVTIVIDDCPDFNIPEGFSPNGDAINDVFVIRGIINYPNNTFLIFNRWGSKVFEASPYQNTWDGTSTIGVKVGGNELPVSTYFYLLDLGDGTNVIKGTIYLNR